MGTLRESAARILEEGGESTALSAKERAQMRELLDKLFILGVVHVGISIEDGVRAIRQYYSNLGRLLAMLGRNGAPLSR